MDLAIKFCHDWRPPKELLLSLAEDFEEYLLGGGEKQSEKQGSDPSGNEPTG